MRGRLLNAFVCTIEHLDPVATQSAHGFDPVFKEPVKLPAADHQGPGTDALVRLTTQLPCQIEVGTLDKLREFFSGNVPDASIILCFHWKDLEAAGLVDSTGHASGLNIGDRLISIAQQEGDFIQTLPDPAYCTQIQPNSFGIGHHRNLLLVTFSCRETAAKV